MSGRIELAIQAQQGKAELTSVRPKATKAAVLLTPHAV
jgi:hypothetical protein